MYLPLKKSEYDRLKYFRFINFVIFENIPQLAIQVYYLSYYSNNKLNILPIVFISVALTVLSLLFGGIKIAISMIDDRRYSPKRTFAYESKIHCHFVIECDKIHPIHSYSHGKIERSLLTVLNTCQDQSRWYGRNDVFYSVECYHIDCEFSLHKLTAYCEFSIYTLEQNHKSVVNRFHANIVDMLHDNSSSIAKELHRVE